MAYCLGSIPAEIKLIPGLVGTGNSKTGFSAITQHFFSGPGATHAFIITYPIGKIVPIDMVFEADMRVVHTAWPRWANEDIQYDFWLYKLINATDEEIEHSLDKCTKEFAGEMYGFLQWPWFAWRWFNEKILHRDIKHQHNWVTDYIICDELWWYFCWYLTEINPDKWSKLRSILSQWNPDTIQSYDVKMIQIKNPDIFLPYAKRENGVIAIL